MINKVLLAFVLCVPVYASGGVLFGSVCYPNAGVAAEAMQAGYPKIENGYVVNVVVSVISESQVYVTYERTDLVTGAHVHAVVGESVVGCSAPSWGFGAYTVQDILFAVGLVIAALLGFISGRMR